MNSNFRMIGGKNSEWADNVLARRTRAFLRFSIELELLGRIGDKVVITPAGFRFILMLQLRKGIAMVEGLSSPMIYNPEKTPNKGDNNEHQNGL